MSLTDRISKLCVLACISTCCYYNTLTGKFVFDDTEAVVKNVDLDPQTALVNIFRNDFWGTTLTSNSSHKSYRPLTVLVYKSVILLAGSKDPFWFHTVNVILYIFVCATLYICLEYIFEEQVAFNSSVLFTAHPIHTEVVSSVVGCADLLCSLFFCLALSNYNRALLGSSSLSYFLTLSFSAIATFCKEIGITALGVCFVTQLILCVKKKLNVKQWWGIQQTGLIISAGTILYFRCLIMNFTQPTFQEVDNPAAFSENILTRILTYNYIYALNILLLLWPQWLCFDWSMGCVPLLEHIYDIRIFVVILFWVLGTVFIYKLIHLCDRSLVLSLTYLVVPFLPATNLLFKVGFVIAERVLFLPSIGLCLLVCSGLNRLCLFLPRCKQYFNIIFWSVIVLFVMRSRERSNDWLNENILYTSALSVCPSNAKVHYNVAKIAADVGELEKAEYEYRLAINLHPIYDQAMNNLANLLRDKGQVVEAKQLLIKAVTLRPSFAAAWMNLGIVLVTLGEEMKAEHAYKLALSHRKKYSDCYYNLGNLYLKQSRHAEALSMWESATAINPLHSAAWSNTLVLLDRLGHLEAAVERGRAALEACPDTAALHFSLANTLGKMKWWEEAEEEFLNALELNPKNALYHSNLGVLYHRWGRLEEAREMYKAALIIDPHLNSTQHNLNKLSKLSIT